MLTIRTAQMEVFEKAALGPFENEMVAHSRQFSPPLCKILGEKQLRVALRGAMEKAGHYGFTCRGPMRLLIEMMFLFGSAFDTDPQYPWAAEILHDKSVEQMDRAEALYHKIVDYQAKVSGPDAANTRRALGELLELTRKPFDLPADRLEPLLGRELQRVFPEKAAYLGVPVLMALIHKGATLGRQRHFPTTRGHAMIVTLMFIFGHGCVRDPLYPWIERMLHDETVIDPAVREEQLGKEAATWLEDLLATAQEETPL